MSVTEIIAVLGLVSGVTGTVLGVLNYLRDRGRVEVSLQWDMNTYGHTEYDPDKSWGVIRVTNAGRRTVCVSHVALKLPKGYGESHLIITSGVGQKTLPEGAASEMHIVSQDGLEKYADRWRDIVAQVSDTRGKEWRSPKLPETARPSWAVKKEQG